jgi:hypothetical protein
VVLKKKDKKVNNAFYRHCQLLHFLQALLAKSALLSNLNLLQGQLIYWFQGTQNNSTQYSEVCVILPIVVIPSVVAPISCLILCIFISTKLNVF